MSERVAEVYSLLVPLLQDKLLVPRACVAEVVGYQIPAQMPGAPPWYLGQISWNGKQLPLISFEGTCGLPMPPTSNRTRIVVFHALQARLAAGAFGLVAQGFPQLVRISSDMVRADQEFARPDRSPILCRVRMLKDSPMIPDPERLESMIADETTGTMS
jgi:chemosensory pili system protein ChpC